ncbi:hypothetical protein BC828DRAFT_389966 [Blastocladiella britannica]|nr:hypothetical protein BC828DRAFT_389966 [Blastocladiella britannica]
MTCICANVGRSSSAVSGTSALGSGLFVATTSANRTLNRSSASMISAGDRICAAVRNTGAPTSPPRTCRCVIWIPTAGKTVIRVWTVTRGSHRARTTPTSSRRSAMARRSSAVRSRTTTGNSATTKHHDVGTWGARGQGDHEMTTSRQRGDSTWMRTRQLDDGGTFFIGGGGRRVGNERCSMSRSWLCAMSQKCRRCLR